MGATHFLMKTLPKVATENGAARTGLQPDQGDEHHGRPATDRGDEGIASPIHTGRLEGPQNPMPTNVFTRPRPATDIELRLSTAVANWP